MTFHCSIATGISSRLQNIPNSNHRLDRIPGVVVILPARFASWAAKREGQATPQLRMQRLQSGGLFEAASFARHYMDSILLAAASSRSNKRLSFALAELAGG